MEAFEDLPILLKFEFVKDVLILRLDNEGLHDFDNQKKAILEITLENTEVSKDDLENTLKKLIGFAFEYEIYPEDNKQIFEYWGNYGVDSKKICFSTYQEHTYSYTEIDLCLKGKTLSKLYLDLITRFDKNDAIFTKTRDKLKTEIKDDITRFERKAEFFEDKSTAYLQSIKALQKLLNILENSND